METTVEKLEDSKVRLTVTVPASEFESAIDAAFKKLAHEVRMPGFRPGKAPRRLLEAQLGTEFAREQALKDAVPEYYLRAIDTESVDVIATPEIDITGGQEEGDVVFDAVVEVRPEVTVTGYDELTVEVPGTSVSDEDVQQQVDSLRERFADLADSDEPLEADHYASIDITTSIDGEVLPALTAEDYLYAVGSGRIVEELDTALIGANAGDTVEFTAQLPEGDFEGAGEEASFTVVVKETKQRVLPEATDEWIAENTEFETLAAFEESIRERVARVKEMQARMAVQEKVLEEIASRVPIEAPETLVNQEMERRLHDFSHDLSHRGMELGQYLQMTGTDQETFINDLRNGAVNGVLADLALRCVAKAEDLVATDEELELEVAQAAAQMGQKPKQVRRELERRGAMQAIRSDIVRAKALRFLVEHAKVVDEEGNQLDLTLSLQSDAGNADGASDEPGENDNAAPETEEQG